jgi:hypothetical protein
MISRRDIIRVGEMHYRTLLRIFADPVSPGFPWADVESLLRALGVSVRHKAETKILECPDPWSPELRRAVVQLRYSDQQVHAGHVQAIRQFLIGLAFIPARINP